MLEVNEFSWTFPGSWVEMSNSWPFQGPGIQFWFSRPFPEIPDLWEPWMTYPWPTLMPMGIVVISCIRPSVQPSMGLGLCIAYKHGSHRSGISGKGRENQNCIPGPWKGQEFDISTQEPGKVHENSFTSSIASPSVVFWQFCRKSTRHVAKTPGK